IYLDVLQVDVEPDVELGPVRQGERADALTLREAPVVEVPELRALVLGIPLAVAIAERVDALLRAGALLVPACATECRVVAALAEGLQQRLGLHDVRVDGAAVIEGVDVVRLAL